MKIGQILSGDIKRELYSKAQRKRNKVKADPLKEKLSDSTLKDLMGINRDTYARRRGGAIGRK